MDKFFWSKGGIKRTLLENSEKVTWQIKHRSRVKRRQQHLNSRLYFTVYFIPSLPKSRMSLPSNIFPKYLEVLATM